MDNFLNTIIRFVVFTCLFLIPISGVTFLISKKLIACIRTIKTDKDCSLRSILITISYLLLVLGGIQLFLVILCVMFGINMSWAPRWVLLVNLILFFVYIIIILPIVYGLGPVVAASGIGSKEIINTAFKKNTEKNMVSKREINKP